MSNDKAPSEPGSEAPGKPGDKASGKPGSQDQPAAGGKKKLIMAALLVLLAGFGGAGYFFFFHKSAKTTAEVVLPENPVYHDLPGLVVDLKTDRCKSPYLKFKPSVLVYPADILRLQQAEKEIVDGMTSFLRSRTRDDMMGMEGNEKLRAGIISIINSKITPAKAMSVLFKEFILQ